MANSAQPPAGLSRFLPIRIAMVRKNNADAAVREFDGGSSEQRRRLFRMPAGAGAALLRGAGGGGCARCGGRRAGLAGGLLEAVGPAELLAEPLHAAGGVDELLLAGEERVALAANIDVDLRRRAAGRERVPAGTVHSAGLITGMDLGFHGLTPCSRRASVSGR